MTQKGQVKIEMNVRVSRTGSRFLLQPRERGPGASGTPGPSRLFVAPAWGKHHSSFLPGEGSVFPASVSAFQTPGVCPFSLMFIIILGTSRIFLSTKKKMVLLMKSYYGPFKQSQSGGVV